MSDFKLISVRTTDEGRKRVESDPENSVFIPNGWRLFETMPDEKKTYYIHHQVSQTKVHEKFGAFAV